MYSSCSHVPPGFWIGFLVACLCSNLAKAQSIDIAGIMHQIKDGRVIVSEERLADALKEAPPGRPVTYPFFFFRNSTKVGDFGLIERSGLTVSTLTSGELLTLRVDTQLSILQRIDGENALIRALVKIIPIELNGRRRSDLGAGKELQAIFLFEGFDFTLLPDGASIDFAGTPVIASGLHEYSNTLGAKTTVIRLRQARLPPLPVQEQAPKETWPMPRHPAFQNSGPSFFEDKTGKYSTRAVPLDYKDGTLTLYVMKQQEEVEIKAYNLSSNDRKWLVDKLREHRENERSAFKSK